MDPIHDEHQVQVTASAIALDKLTTAAADHPIPPLEHIHAASSKTKSHSWIRNLIPSTVLESYESRYHLGNYVVDRQTGTKTFEDMSIYVRLGMHFLYYGYYQQKFLANDHVEQLLREQSVKMGLSYDSPESKDHIVPFIESFDLWGSMDEMVKPDPAQYATFNEFFSREIQVSARPVQDEADPRTTCSVADCRMTCFPTVDLATRYWIKGTGFTLERLLRDADLAREFDGGSVVIARLAPQDYHRWHSPVNGLVEGVRKIDGTYYTVNPQAVNQEGTLNVFCENRRDVMVIRRDGSGRKVVVVAVGAMLVGSIKWLPGLEEPGALTRRGECQGYFQYGGSTVITLYQKDDVVLDEDLVRNSTDVGCETLMKVGWRVGTLG